MNTGKCPKCEKLLTHVDAEAIEIHQNLKSASRGVSYLCPHCRTILSVQIDPLASIADMANAVVRRLKKAEEIERAL
jgi:phage FluMu protein Com